jgi:hypothetical protein
MGGPMATMEILLPTPPLEADAQSTVYSLGRPLTGVRVGLRLDRSWRSYFTVVDVWTALFEARGATVHVLFTGDRAGPEAEQTRNDLEEWSRLVEVGVVGLGN